MKTRNLYVGTSVSWPKAVFSKTLIWEKKPITTFVVISWITISGTWNYIKIPQPDWPKVLVIWASFKRQKIEVHIFQRASLSGFCTWKFTAKEELNPRKQAFLLNLRLWLSQKPKIWSIFYTIMFVYENSVVWKLGSFRLEISTFPRLLVIATRVVYLVPFTMA